ncbi:hypothetical protein AMECASPLE_018004, partial [Ameca splendens]
CLREALMEIRKMSCQITDTELYYVKTNHTYTLKEFYDTQLKQQHEILSDLQPFRDLVRDVTVRAGHEYLLQHQTTSEDKDELNLVFFNRVNCFIRHVDNLIFNTVYCLVLNALGVLLNVLQNQVGQMPSQITPQVRSDRSEAVPEENVEKKVGQFLSIYFSNGSYYLLQIILDIIESYWFMFVSKVLPDLPLFMSELVLESDVLMYNPSEENFQETIREIIRQFKTAAISVRSLTADPEMDLLLKSEKFKDSVQGGPSLDTVLKEDGHLRVIIQNISDSVHTAFDSAKVYSHTFDHFLAFSKNNENLDLDAVWELETGSTLAGSTLLNLFCECFHYCLFQPATGFLDPYSSTGLVTIYEDNQGVGSIWITAISQFCCTGPRSSTSTGTSTLPQRGNSSVIPIDDLCIALRDADIFVEQAEGKAGSQMAQLITKSNALRGSKEKAAELKNIEEEILAKGEELRFM